MSSAVAELETGLNAMLILKPPGVSGSQIKTITALCVDNVQSESVLIQKIYTHFKKTPGTHKLGVLYVVDSVTRRWIELNKQQGQSVNSSAPDGTYAAAVHRVTELLPVLMNDILQSAPKEQKEKIKKLVDIWEKGQTFPMSMIETFKQKLNAPEVKKETTTPIGSPPPGPGLPGLPGFNGAAPESKTPTSAAPNAILDALANIARQNTSNGQPAPDHSYNSLIPQNGQAQQSHLPVTQSQGAFSFPGVPPAVNAPVAMPYAYAPQAPYQGQPAVPVTASTQPSGFPGPGAPQMLGAAVPAFTQQVQLIKLLLDQGIPQEQIPKILATMQSAVPPSATATAAAPAPALAPPGPPQAQIPPYGGNSWGQTMAKPDESRDRLDTRSPNRYRNRTRSRSPQRHWSSRGSPRGHNDRVYGGYGSDSPGRGRIDDHTLRGRDLDYRQRSPPDRRGRSPSLHYDSSDSGQRPKWVEFDHSIPQGSIKVLSRTLFVGGVTIPESDLRDLFGQHGQVQTCIVNKDKRHAFVKMINRRDAISAKEAMENSQFRTRWGVGFGPRDCSDYASGVSVIPIAKLTEADRKWMLTAPYGGSGGRPIESGMVVEEPDIEIGAGVSSKAISRRMQTDKGGRHGPKSSRGGDDDDVNLNRWRRNKDGRRDDRRDDRGPTLDGPAVPDFPYGLTAGPNGMPMFPPGFTFPAPNH